MASTKQQENMLLTEHFTWPPISLIDDIINAVNEVLYRCTDSFETGLSSADPALLGFADHYASENRTPSKDEDGQDVYPEAKLEIEEGVLKLETLMENAVDKNFDKLEIWTLRNVLCLPRGEEELARWVRLGHYENIDTTKTNPNLTPETLFHLRRQLIETRTFHAALLAERTRNEATLARLKALLQPSLAPKRESSAASDTQDPATQTPPFAFLTHTPAAQSLGLQALPQASSTSSSQTTTPLSTHTSFTTSQLPHLRQLLDTLKTHLPATALPRDSKASKAEDTQERKVYVESQSKRVLERRGVDTKDGVEGVWDGVRVRGEEVRGLEGLVEGMERGGREKKSGGGGEDGQEGDKMDLS